MISMTVDCVLDTNVLVYAAARPGTEEKKRNKARELIALPFGLSAQILQEFFVTVTRKVKSPMQPVEALEWIEQFEEQPCVPIDVSLVKRGIESAARYKISYWDGAVIAAAETLRAEVLYSEDLNDGQLYGTVRVINPFARL
jgi:predicted nucleic acid-binding protein